MKRLCGLLLLAALLLPTSAAADTPGCVSHAEFDNTTAYLSPAQITNRYDVAGTYLGAADGRWRKGYPTCWADDRRVIVWFSLVTDLSVDWAVRDA